MRCRGTSYLNLPWGHELFKCWPPTSTLPNDNFKNDLATGHMEMIMPIPTPPKKDLLKVSPPRPATRKAAKPKGPSKSTQKLVKDIRHLTKTLDENSVEIPAEKKPARSGKNPGRENSPKQRSTLAEHMTQNPFRDSEVMQQLQRELRKETDPKKPVKRSPRRKPAHKTGDK